MPPLRIELATLRQIVIVTLTGDFVRPSCLELRDVIKPLIEEGFRCFVIEFDVSQLDEAGFGEFVSTYTTVANLGGQIATKPNQLFRDVGNLQSAPPDLMLDKSIGSFCECACKGHWNN